MNKKWLTLGISALAVAFLVTTSFKKTREQQLAEIDQTVTMKLDELRTQKDAECTERVNQEAQRRFDEILVQREAASKGKPSASKKPSTGKGPSVTPLPQPSKPESNRDRGDAANPQNNRERGDAVEPTKSNRERGDAKQGGGN